MSIFSQCGIALPACMGIMAASVFVGSTRLRPASFEPQSGVVSSCLPTPTHWWPIQRRIKELVHPITDPADSLTTKGRIATRLPLLDSSLVTTVTNDSLCQIAKKKYGLFVHGDSLKVSQITLLRLGDSAYAVGDIESRPGLNQLFLVLTFTWEWRGGNLAPVNWPGD